MGAGSILQGLTVGGVMVQVEYERYDGMVINEMYNKQTTWWSHRRKLQAQVTWDAETKI